MSQNSFCLRRAGQGALYTCKFTDSAFELFPQATQQETRLRGEVRQRVAYLSHGGGSDRHDSQIREPRSYAQRQRLCTCATFRGECTGQAPSHSRAIGVSGGIERSAFFPRASATSQLE